MYLFHSWNCFIVSSFISFHECSVVSNSLWPNGLHGGFQGPLPMKFSRQDYWMGCHFLLQGIFPTQKQNLSVLRLLHGQADSLPRASPEKPVSVCCCSAAQSCPTLCDPMHCRAPGVPVLHHLLGFAQTHVHWVGDTIQPSHPLSPASPAFNPSQYPGLY